LYYKNRRQKYIFVTHDIGLAYYVSDTVYIMEHGKFVESGSADKVILTPQAEYTNRLISDVPKIYEPWDFTAAGKRKAALANAN
jgi:peptide/nickel transport system ATP-binding protein